MARVMRGHSRADDQLGMFVICDLGIIDEKFVKDLLSPLLPLGIGTLGLVRCNLRGGLVATPACRNLFASATKICFTLTSVKRTS